MSKIEFIPETFHQVKLIDGDINSAETVCTPGYPDCLRVAPFNKIVMNCPNVITYYIDEIDGVPQLPKPVLPICIYYIISLRRSLKYHHLKDTIHIRKLDSDKWSFGVVEVIYEDSVPNPYYDEKAELLEIEEAQKYSDKELDTGQGSGGVKSFNLFDFVTLPLTSGIFEVYFSANGLESRHLFVEVIINDGKK